MSSLDRSLFDAANFSSHQVTGEQNVFFQQDCHFNRHQHHPFQMTRPTNFFQEARPAEIFFQTQVDFEREDFGLNSNHRNCMPAQVPFDSSFPTSTPATSAVGNTDYGYCVTKNCAESAMKSVEGGRSTSNHLRHASNFGRKNCSKQGTQTGNKRLPHEYQVLYGKALPKTYSSTSEQSVGGTHSGMSSSNLTQVNEADNDMQYKNDKKGSYKDSDSKRGSSAIKQAHLQEQHDSKATSNRRRIRHNFTANQSKCLEDVFDSMTHYPDFSMLLEQSKKLRLPVERIQVWFQNRRAKFRRNTLLHVK